MPNINRLQQCVQFKPKLSYIWLCLRNRHYLKIFQSFFGVYSLLSFVCLRRILCIHNGWESWKSMTWKSTVNRNAFSSLAQWIRDMILNEDWTLIIFCCCLHVKIRQKKLFFISFFPVVIHVIISYICLFQAAYRSVFVCIQSTNNTFFPIYS